MRIDARVVKAFPENSKGKIRAIVSLNIEDSFAVHGIKIIDSCNGLFLQCQM